MSDTKLNSVGDIEQVSDKTAKQNSVGDIEQVSDTKLNRTV